MGLRERTESYFARQVRTERERRGWTQDDLAKQLTDKGIDTYASTVAKIESEKKPRAVRLAEAAAIADLFGVSVDSLLGRRVGLDDDIAYTLRMTGDTARRASDRIAAIVAELNDRLVEVSALEFNGNARLKIGLQHAVNALLAVAPRLRDVAEFQPSPSALPVVQATDPAGRQALRKMVDQSRNEIADET
jgi:transcriptional regulator with XRE-family HTH domain